MNLHYSLEREADAPPLVLSIGFFDGMHRGHGDIAREARRLRRPGWRVAALTFSNHPSAFLRPGSEPPLISTLEERLDLLAAAGYEDCFLLPFDERIAAQEAEPFLREILLRQLGVRGVVVGKSFRFGHKREGDTQLMASIFAEADVVFAALGATRDAGGERISSTRIRECIARGDVERADDLLGHAYELRGCVELGAGRGHALGFPTANIGVPHKLLPKEGVYAAVARYDGRDYAALVSIGTNPTFNASVRTIEAWLRDFEGTMYGKEVALRDLRFVRDQRRFATIGELQAQMREDARAVAYPTYG